MQNLRALYVQSHAIIYLSMVIVIIFSLGIGFIVGFFLGRGLNIQQQAAPFLGAGSLESDAIHAEAQKAVQERIEKRKNRILEMVERDGSITNDGVEDLFCISDRTASRYLRELVSIGRLTKIGKTGRGVHFVSGSTE